MSTVRNAIRSRTIRLLPNRYIYLLLSCRQGAVGVGRRLGGLASDGGQAEREIRRQYPRQRAGQQRDLAAPDPAFGDRLRPRRQRDWTAQPAHRPLLGVFESGRLRSIQQGSVRRRRGQVSRGADPPINVTHSCIFHFSFKKLLTI